MWRWFWGDLFSCGGCGGQTALGVDDRTASHSTSCGGGVAFWELRWFGEGQSSKTLTNTCSCHLWSGAWVWTVWIIALSIKVCMFRSFGDFSISSCGLTTSFKLTDTSLSYRGEVCHLVRNMWIIKFYVSQAPMIGCWYLICATCDGCCVCVCVCVFPCFCFVLPCMLQVSTINSCNLEHLASFPAAFKTWGLLHKT